MDGGGEIRITELSIGAPARRFFIADNVVEPDAAAAIFARVRRLGYGLDDSDRPDTDDFRHFKHEFPVGSVEEGGDPLAAMLADKARELLGSQGIECGEVFRIYANLNMFGDFQFAHEDGEGWTALLFANPVWEEDWAGDFLAYPDDGSHFAYSILPKPGTMLIFDGLIRHRGGTPSKFCHLPRITIAIKFHP